MLRLIRRKQVPMRFGLERMKILVKSLDLNFDCSKYIHVAGTNGKGSVIRKIASQLSGSIGVYTSPHISTILERIQINAIPISMNQINLYLDRVENAEKKTNIEMATYFETMTLLSFIHFCEHKVDYALIETGMGGLEDATNIIPRPEVCVLTSVSLDHQDWLGGTIDEITQNKSGIFKSGSHVVVGPDVKRDITSNLAHRVGVKSFTAVELPPSVTKFNVNLVNSYISSKVLSILGVNCNLQNLIGVIPPCRQEVLCYKNKTVILDGAHNPAALEALRSDVIDTLVLSHKKVCFCLTFSKGRDIKALISALNPRKNESIFCALGDSKTNSVPAEEIISNVKELNLEAVGPFENITLSFLAAMERNFDCIIVCGSFHSLGSVKELINNTPKDSISLNE